MSNNKKAHHTYSCQNMKKSANKRNYFKFSHTFTYISIQKGGESYQHQELWFLREPKIPFSGSKDPTKSIFKYTKSDRQFARKILLCFGFFLFLLSVCFCLFKPKIFAFSGFGKRSGAKMFSLLFECWRLPNILHLPRFT